MAARRPLALATFAALPRLADDDRLLADALEARGVAAAPAVWDDPAVDWASFAGVMIRCCWDYHLKLPAFLAWLDALERAGVRVWNPPATLRGNVTKDYLKRVPSRVPTHWIEPGSEADLDSILAERGWDEAVVKPVVSASAHATRRVRRGDASGRAALAEAVGAHGAMVQPFLPEILADGEWSLIFLDGAFSHAVRKTPAPGDFRVQEEHGGRSARVEPDGALVSQAEAALRGLGAEWLYARVDGVRSGAGLLISEIELVEPSLYFAYGPEAARRLAAALAARL